MVNELGEAAWSCGKELPSNPQGNHGSQSCPESLKIMMWPTTGISLSLSLSRLSFPNAKINDIASFQSTSCREAQTLLVSWTELIDQILSRNFLHPDRPGMHLRGFFLPGNFLLLEEDRKVDMPLKLES